MKKNIIISLTSLFLLTGLSSCSEDAPEPVGVEADSRHEMTFMFSLPQQAARVTDTSFESGDRVGLYVVESGSRFETAGNAVNNEGLTFNGSAWKGTRNIYWNDGIYTAYAYHPYQAEVSSITDFPFAVQADQSGAGFGQSDFLHASAQGLVASGSPVSMTFRHIMSKLTVRLIKGEDFKGEIPEDAVVRIHSTVPDATVDLEAGIATLNYRSTARTITAHKDATGVYSAIIVPQRLSNRVPFVEVIAGGVSFLYDSRFLFKPGVNHLVNLVLDRNPEQAKIEIGGEIGGWN
ncbi:MAG: fimbrillin family protein [Duncaniella sp.]|nr:fimbrillin family protein [Duncaniella sp.]